MQIYGNTATWQTATLFSSLLNVFKEGASTTVSSSSSSSNFFNKKLSCATQLQGCGYD